MKMDNMNSAKTESRKAVVFPNEETFEQIFEECLVNEPQASQKLQDANKALTSAYWEYLAEYEKHTFRFAYQCGYEAAMDKMKLRVCKNRAMTPVLKEADRKLDVANESGSNTYEQSTDSSYVLAVGDKGFRISIEVSMLATQEERDQIRSIASNIAERARREGETA